MLPDTPFAPADAARERLTRDLREVAKGDRAALKRVYTATSAKLFGVCLRILDNRQDAEDALQEAYVTVWRKAAAFDRDKGSPITWLVTLTRNRALDRLRARRPLADSPLDLAAELPDSAPPADATIDADRAGARLAACLDGLGKDERRLIRAAFLEGSSYSELAARAALPLGTVKSRIRRSLIKLRGCLEP